MRFDLVFVLILSMVNEKKYIPPARLVRRVKTKNGYLEIVIHGRDKKVVISRVKDKGEGEGKKRMKGV